MHLTVTFLLAIAGGVSSVVAQNTLTSSADVEAAAATALTLSPTSHVKGRAFDRFAIIFLENTDSAAALEDREYSLILVHVRLNAKSICTANLQALQKLGITLTNYNAVTHPSEPNYIAPTGGDYFGLE